MGNYAGLLILVIMSMLFTVPALVLGALGIGLPTLGWMSAVSWIITGVASFGLVYNHAEYANFWQNWEAYFSLVAFVGFGVVMMLAAIGWKTSNEKDEEPDKEEEQDGESSGIDIEDRSERRRGLLWKVRDARRERTRNLKNQAVLRKTNARIARGG